MEQKSAYFTKETNSVIIKSTNEEHLKKERIDNYENRSSMRKR